MFGDPSELCDVGVQSRCAKRERTTLRLVDPQAAGVHDSGWEAVSHEFFAPVKLPLRHVEK